MVRPRQFLRRAAGGTPRPGSKGEACELRVGCEVLVVTREGNSSRGKTQGLPRASCLFSQEDSPLRSIEGIGYSSVQNRSPATFWVQLALGRSGRGGELDPRAAWGERKAHACAKASINNHRHHASIKELGDLANPPYLLLLMKCAER